MSELFTLAVNPTFESKVKIQIVGKAEPGELPVTFRHHPCDEYSAYLKEIHAKLEAEDLKEEDAYPLMVAHLKHILAGWGLPDMMEDNNLRTLITNYSTAYVAITTTYFAELMGYRAKN